MRSLLLLLMLPAAAQTPTSLRGAVTDPSGAAVPGAVVQLRGPGGERRARTGNTGEYSFPSLAAGRYRITIAAKGFSTAQQTQLTIERPPVFDAQLVIATRTQVLNVEDALGRVSAEPGSNGSAVVMRQRQL